MEIQVNSLLIGMGLGLWLGVIIQLLLLKINPPKDKP